MHFTVASTVILKLSLGTHPLIFQTVAKVKSQRFSRHNGCANFNRTAVTVMYFYCVFQSTAVVTEVLTDNIILNTGIELFSGSL